MWLWIGVDARFRFLYHHPPFNPRNMCCAYLLPPEGVAIWKQWQGIRDDRHLSGILADWLEDHADELMPTATGMDGDRRLYDLINYLRSRFHEQEI